MRGMSVWPALCAAGLFSVAVMAGEKAPDSYVKVMKDISEATKSLKTNVEGKNYDGVGKDAVALKGLFEANHKFWDARKAQDAVTAAGDGVKAAGDLATAAKAKNDAGVEAAAKALNATCKTCHDAHRERLPDGSSEIK